MLISLHALNNIEITNYSNDEPRLNGIFSRNNLPRIKNEVYQITRDDKNDKGIHWVPFFIHKNVAICFDVFGIEYIPQ